MKLEKFASSSKISDWIGILPLTRFYVTNYFGKGIDGDLNISSLTSVNSYAYITNSSLTTSQNSCTVDTISGFSIGQRVLIHQTQCSSNTILAGKMQENIITNISGNNITFSKNFDWSIVSNASNSSAANTCQIISVPQYSNVNIQNGGTLVPGQYWNGTKGGILIIEVSGNLIINSGGTIHANAYGFRGGDGGTAAAASIGSGGIGGYSGEGITGGGLSYGTRAANGGSGASGAGGNGHVNLHSVKGGNGYYQNTVANTGGTGYGAGGGSDGSDSGGGGGAGGAYGGQLIDVSTFRASLGGGAGGGGGGSCGNNGQQNSAPGGGGGAGGGLIILRCTNITNGGTISARPGYGAGANGVVAARGSGGGATAGGIGGNNTTSGNGQTSGTQGSDIAGSFATSVNVTATSGGSGTGVGGVGGYGATSPNDYGGRGGYTGVSGGGNGGGGTDSNVDGAGGGGAGGSGGGGGGSGWDVGSGGGGGQGASGGIIWIETNSFSNIGTIVTPRGIGGGGGGTTSGGTGNGGSGGDAQYNPSSATGYLNGASGWWANAYNWSGGGGAAGYVGDIGKTILYTQNGLYSGIISQTDNGQQQTGTILTIGSLQINVSPFLWS